MSPRAWAWCLALATPAWVAIAAALVILREIQ